MQQTGSGIRMGLLRGQVPRLTGGQRPLPPPGPGLYARQPHPLPALPLHLPLHLLTAVPCVATISSEHRVCIANDHLGLAVQASVNHHSQGLTLHLCDVNGTLCGQVKPFVDHDLQILMCQRQLSILAGPATDSKPSVCRLLLMLVLLFVHKLDMGAVSLSNTMKLTQASIDQILSIMLN